MVGIEEFLKLSDARLTYEDKWLVWADTWCVWQVYQKEYRTPAKRIYEGDSLEEALKVLANPEY